jgi:hypothetical protein
MVREFIALVMAMMFLSVGSTGLYAGAPPGSRPAEAPPSVIVPEGNGEPVLLDGLFAPGEWDDALKVRVHERVDLFLKKNAGHLFLGLKFKDGLGVIVDLWMTADDKTVYQFHSSGQLGEGTLTLPAADEWPGTRIGYTKDWDANEIKSDNEKRAEWQAAGRPAEGYRQTLFPSDGKEFQIVLSKFPSRGLKMRFRAGEPEGLIVYPETTDLKSTSGWLELIIPEDEPAGDEEAQKREIARALLAKGAKVDAPDPEVSTPLHPAVKKGRAERVRFLLEKAAAER